MKRVKPYIFIAVVLASMIIVFCHYQFYAKYEVVAPIETVNSKIDKNLSSPMDTNLLLVLLSTIGILAGVLFNPRLSNLSRKIEDYQSENRSQHSVITDSIKHFKMRHDLELSLREIVNGILEITTGELSRFIDFEGNLFIDLVQEIVTGPLNVSALPALRVKLEHAKDASNKRASQLGEAFYNLHAESQERFLKQLYGDIESTLTDEVFNTKYKRISMACERTLHEHLTDSVRSYMGIKNTL